MTVQPTLIVVLADLTEVPVYAPIGVRLDIDEEFPALAEDATEDDKVEHFVTQMNEIALRSLKAMGKLDPDVEMREWLRGVLRIGFPEETTEVADPLDDTEEDPSES